MLVTNQWLSMGLFMIHYIHHMNATVMFEVSNGNQDCLSSQKEGELLYLCNMLLINKFLFFSLLPVSKDPRSHMWHIYFDVCPQKDINNLVTPPSSIVLTVVSTNICWPVKSALNLYVSNVTTVDDVTIVCLHMLTSMFWK